MNIKTLLDLHSIDTSKFDFCSNLWTYSNPLNKNGTNLMYLAIAHELYLFPSNNMMLFYFSKDSWYQQGHLIIGNQLKSKENKQKLFLTSNIISCFWLYFCNREFYSLDVVEMLCTY